MYEETYEDILAAQDLGTRRFSEDRFVAVSEGVGSRGRPYVEETHWHSWLELLLVEEGSLTVELGSSAIELGPGDLLYIPYYVVHSIHASDVRVTCLHLNSVTLSQLYQWYDPLRVDCCSATDTSGRSYLSLARHVREMRRLIDDHSDLGKLGMQGACCSLLYELYAGWLTEEGYHPVRAGEDWFRAVLSWTMRNYNEGITQREVAHRFGVSPQHLARTFRSILGLSFVSYIRAVQISHAEYLLVHTDQKIVDILYSTGFTSKQSFTRAFRKQFGMLPSEYRALHSVT